VQGQLRGEDLSFTIETACAYSGQPVHIEIDSQLRYRVLEAAADPHVYVPMVDFGKLDDPCIIDAF
jgi:hypothetical protein